MSSDDETDKITSVMYIYSVIKLDVVVKVKAASEQELSHTKLLNEQEEAKLCQDQRKLEDFFKKTDDSDDTKPNSNLQSTIMWRKELRASCNVQSRLKKMTLPSSPWTEDQNETEIRGSPGGSNQKPEEIHL